MPANTQHEAFPQPPDADVIIWRYMDLPRLVSMLHTKHLHFAQLASLSDQYEGEIPSGFKAARAQGFKKAHPDRADEAESRSKAEIAHARACTYVSCWFMQACESEAFWRIYAGPTGIAIRSQYSRLVEVLPSTGCYVGMVRYLDYKGSEFPDGNLFHLAMHKRRPFDYEHEVRALRCEPSDSAAWGIAAWKAEPPPPLPKGRIEPIDPSRLIEAVFVSPYAKEWFKHVVDAILERFGLGMSSQWSGMR